MVLLTMTGAVVEALKSIHDLAKSEDDNPQPCVPNTDGGSNEAWKQREKELTEDAIEHSKEDEQLDAQEKPRATASDEAIKNVAASPSSEPSLLSPQIGNPVSHGQIINLAKEMKIRGLEPCRLEILLQGSRVYIPPPPPKPEPTPEYKALMARLRREEEKRSYERMTNPPPPMETFSQRFPAASAAHAFAGSHAQVSEPEDEVTYADIDRQMSVILNVLFSIIACAAAIWVAARWWSTPMRLALSMSGSMLVGVAEVVVYAGYIRRVGEAKGKEKSIKEMKEVVNTWVVGPPDDEKENIPKEPLAIGSIGISEEFKARKRK